MGTVVHPYVVHFSVALIVLSAALFALGAAFRFRPWSAGLLQAARWNLWIGAGFALASIGSGFVDYIRIPCDQAAIEATVLHRRSGAVTWWSSLIAAVAVYRTRSRAPGPYLLGWLGLVAIAAITATWLGTTLTYRHGLAVERAWTWTGQDCYSMERESE